MNRNVTIPAKHYVGMVVRHNSKIPLGFITPWGEDKAAQKRMSTVDSWCGASRAGSIPTSIIENIPMHGFRLTSGIRTGQYGAADHWRIEDPRGFELEISSENLAMVLAVCTLEKGEILEKCVWAREKGKNLLLTTESQDYIDAVSMTNIATSSASWKDVKLGNKITLQNGISGIYLGKLHTLREKYRDYTIEHENIVETSTASLHFILDKNYTSKYNKNINSALHSLASPKLSSIDSTDELSVEECEQLALSKIEDNTCENNHAGYKTIILVSGNKIKDKSWTFKFVPEPDVANPWAYRPADNRPVYVKLRDGKIARIENTSYRNKPHEVHIMNASNIESGTIEYDKQVHKSSRGYYSNQQETTYVVNAKEINPSDVLEILRLELEYKTNAGSILKTFM